MKAVRKSLISAAVMAAAVPSIAVLGATPAVAEVWGCHAEANQAENRGYAYCNAGFGTYRVRVECNSGHWPYTRTLYGPWVYKSQDGMGFLSEVRGQPNGCHVVKAWIEIA
jgi:hypothetical protein